MLSVWAGRKARHGKCFLIRKSVYARRLCSFCCLRWLSCPSVSFVCLSVWRPACLSVCLSVCLPLCLLVTLHFQRKTNSKCRKTTNDLPTPLRCIIHRIIPELRPFRPSEYTQHARRKITIKISQLRKKGKNTFLTGSRLHPKKPFLLFIALSLLFN